MHAFWFVAAFGASALAAPYSTCNTTVATGQIPFTFPLANGFPDVDATTLRRIQSQAHGTLPNTTLPTSIADTSFTVFELIAFNELFEVAFFTSLLSNMTNEVRGYRIGDSGIESRKSFDTALRSLSVIVAQEQLHALGANKILAAAGRNTISPCQYKFPSSTFAQAITFAATFTDVVLGTLQGAISAFALDGDVAFTTLIASVIGNEAEQEGFFRLTESAYNNPSSLPFLTASAAPFAFSALNQQVIVPGTCPNLTDIALPVFSPLIVSSRYVSSYTSSVSFNITTDNTTLVESLSLVYINQQNLPIVEPLQNVTMADGKVGFKAAFPYNNNINGLVIAALTKTPGPFANASEVAQATVFGPGLIEVS
ncbi:putative sexual development protein [Myriangium duriaei CBS 260.36]|uniref:Sexual development protein n=1 Tax=Myriangium duriaei CBS 260.36 TaxID=1168546 RepID=A0A9P4J1W9_9PEZI|nr:putative sexual development protein [Myriangium duriaei CBS 260.36]